MSGALIDLVAKGVQDAFLTGDPQVSFFRQSYKRHVNFAMKNVQLTHIGTQTSGNTITIKIPNKGDLLNYIWLDLGSGSLAGDGIGAIETSPSIFELWIGGQLIDRQDAFYMVQLWNKYLLDSGAKGMACQSDSNDATVGTSFTGSRWMPLHFFFCDSDSCNLPLVALQYNEVEIRMKVAGGSNLPLTTKFYANYVMLDKPERDYFVNTNHEILIEQVQRILPDTNTKTSAEYNLGLLNHPVKCLLWGNPRDVAVTGDVQIYLNGNELFDSKMPDIFFTQVQGYYHSEHASELLKLDGGDNMKMYSFAIKASKHQPTGTCNFSRLDNASLSITDGSLLPIVNAGLYAVNYNILRIKKGMGGLAFSN